MLRNIKLTIEYDGTGYFGWQKQKDKKTIQETIERILEKILQEKIKLVGSGRTDSGVHAKGQIANFKTNSKLKIKNIQAALNSLLPKDICIVRIEEVPLNFHSQYDVKSKIYRYTVLNSFHRLPLSERHSYFFPCRLDVRSIQREAKLFLGEHNFRSFQNSDKKEKNSVRKIKNLKIKKERDFIYFDIEANGFLKGMARNIVGSLLEIGRGRFKEGVLKKILDQKDRRKAGPSVPAKGLCLLRVNY